MARISRRCSSVGSPLGASMPRSPRTIATVSARSGGRRLTRSAPGRGTGIARSPRFGDERHRPLAHDRALFACLYAESGQSLWSRSNSLALSARLDTMAEFLQMPGLAVGCSVVMGVEVRRMVTAPTGRAVVCAPDAFPHLPLAG
ncbi:hypothetical protein ABIA32_004056 [Streptacidiphilus sp. MAP12-20]|uniref:hypothetical protein n=1 Tax=Streptacidiphilus sp. MAP12-20 TaxID=3156299 RepID=UPI0035170F38